MPDRKAALARLHEIVRGIDKDEIYDEDGWWETSFGVEFGAARLAELDALICSLTPEP